MSRKRIERSRFYPYPPEVVWCALTDPRAMAEWMMPNDFRAEVGHRFTYQIDPMPVCGSRADGEVLEVDRPRRLVYSLLDYDTKGRPKRDTQTITWTLTPEGEGTRVYLLHEGIEVHGLVQRMMLRFGWGPILGKMLPKVMANVRAEGEGFVFEPGAIPLEKRCYKCATVPEHLVR